MDCIFVCARICVAPPKPLTPPHPTHTVNQEIEEEIEGLEAKFKEDLDGLQAT